MQKTLADSEYNQFRLFLEQQCGIVLGDNKQYLVKSRLAPLMVKYGAASLGELVQRAMSARERDLRAVVIDAMTTNETQWFRDIYPFELLKSKLLPEYAKAKTPVKIWSAACSSGQEPYSIAMTILEYNTSRPGALPSGAQITATDISATMLEQCKAAEYDSLALARGLSPERKKLFFEKVDDNRMRLSARVRNLVNFRPANLLESYALLGKFDIIFCRNVLIYF
nr:protein-glutamate O-methyltransferase CheR [Corallincola sp.]